MYILTFASVKAFKDCTDDGTWWRNPFNKTWSNYTACINQKELEVRRHRRMSVSVSLSILHVFLRLLFCLYACMRVSPSLSLYVSINQSITQSINQFSFIHQQK